jgi:hypothetical protein
MDFVRFGSLISEAPTIFSRRILFDENFVSGLPKMLQHQILLVLI